MQMCEAHLSLRSPCTFSVGSVCVSVTPSEKTVGEGTADIKKNKRDSQFTGPLEAFRFCPPIR